MASRRNTLRPDHGVHGGGNSARDEHVLNLRYRKKSKARSDVDKGHMAVRFCCRCVRHLCALAHTFWQER